MVTIDAVQDDHQLRHDDDGEDPPTSRIGVVNEGPTLLVRSRAAHGTSSRIADSVDVTTPDSVGLRLFVPSTGCLN